MRPVSSCLTRVSVGVLFMGLVAGCVSYSTGGGNPHVTEAMTHARKAVEPSNIGTRDVVVIHAEVSLQHAQAAKKDINNPRMNSGLLS